MGVDVHPLDKSKPFSAARARNEGFAHMLAKYPASTERHLRKQPCVA